MLIYQRVNHKFPQIRCLFLSMDSFQWASSWEAQSFAQICDPQGLMSVREHWRTRARLGGRWQGRGSPLAVFPWRAMRNTIFMVNFPWNSNSIYHELLLLTMVYKMTFSMIKNLPGESLGEKSLESWEPGTVAWWKCDKNELRCSTKNNYSFNLAKLL